MVSTSSAASALTNAEILLLVALDGAAGRLRQAELSGELGWQPSRLSHQLTRMAARGLVVREEVGAQLVVHATDEGLRRLGETRPVFLAEVRRQLVDPVADVPALRATLEALLWHDRP